ncbi:hypothetical protein WA158_001012 [Blastocystis sp. Blastoise]
MNPINIFDPTCSLEQICGLFEQCCLNLNDFNKKKESEELLIAFQKHPSIFDICKQCLVHSQNGICKFHNFPSLPSYVLNESFLSIAYIFKRLWYNAPTEMAGILFNNLLVASPTTNVDIYTSFSIDLLLHLILAFKENHVGMHMAEGRQKSCQRAFASNGLKQANVYTMSCIFFFSNACQDKPVNEIPTEILTLLEKTINLFTELLRWPWEQEEVNTRRSPKSDGIASTPASFQFTEHISPPKEYEQIYTNPNLIKCLFILYSLFRLCSGSLSSLLFDCIFLLINMSGSSYSSSQIHSQHIYTILEYIYHILNATIEEANQTQETPDLLFDDVYTYKQRETERIALLFHKCIYASHHLLEDECYKDMMEDYKSIYINLIDIVNYFVLDKDILKTVEDIPLYIYQSYIYTQLSLSSLSLLYEQSENTETQEITTGKLKRKNYIDNYLEREENEEKEDMDELITNISTIGRININENCDYLSHLLQERLETIKQGGNQNTFCILSEDIYTLFTYITYLVSDKKEKEIPLDLLDYCDPISSMFILLNNCFNAIMTLYTYQEQNTFYISPLLTTSIFIFINQYIPLYLQYHIDYIPYIFTLSLSSLEYMAEEEEAFITVSNTIYELVDYMYTHKQQSIQYSLVSKLVDSYYISFDLQKKHKNSSKYYTYIYDINDKQWLYLSNIVFSLNAICSAEQLSIQNLLTPLSTCCSQLIQTDKTALNSLLSSPTYIYQVIQLYSVLRGIVHSYCSKKQEVIQYLLNTLTPSLSLFDELHQYEGITTVLIKYFKDMTLLLYHMNPSQTSSFIQNICQLTYLYTKLYKHKFTNVIDPAQTPNLSRLISTLEYIGMNINIDTTPSSTLNIETSQTLVSLVTAVVQLLPLFTEKLLKYPQMTISIYTLLHVMFSQYTSSFARVSEGWDTIISMINYGMTCYGVETKSYDCISILMEYCLDEKVNNREGVPYINMNPGIPVAFLKCIFENLLLTPANKTSDELETISSTIFLFIYNLNTQECHDLITNIICSQKPENQIKLKSAFDSLIQPDALKGYKQRFVRWEYQKVFKHFCSKARTIIDNI